MEHLSRGSRRLPYLAGANLKRMIAENGYTQESFAEAFGCSERTVRRWVKEFPNLDTLEELIIFFDVPVTEFFRKVA